MKARSKFTAQPGRRIQQTAKILWKPATALQSSACRVLQFMFAGLSMDGIGEVKSCLRRRSKQLLKFQLRQNRWLMSFMIVSNGAQKKLAGIRANTWCVLKKQLQYLTTLSSKFIE